MSEREDDLRLERELRGLLDGRDPGPAPYGLRGRVDRVPEEHPLGRRVTVRRVLPYLAAAAAIGVLVIGIASIGRLPGGIGAGPTAVPATGTGEGVTVAVFDPRTTGVGIADPVPVTFLVLLVVAVTAALGFVALGSDGRRRLVVAGLAVAVPVGALGLTTQNLPEEGSGAGSGAGTVADPTPERIAFNVTAEPGEPFWFAFSVRNPGPLPMQLEGVVERLDPEAESRPPEAAAWLDAGTTRGEFGGPGLPLTPVTVQPGDEVVVWLVDRADACTQGDTLEAGERLTGSTTARSAVIVRTSVLGWPRQSEVPFPFDVVQRYVQPCAAPTP